MENKKQKFQIQDRIIAVQLTHSRQQSQKSISECASFLSIPVSEYEKFETGEKSPSLPELEALSYLFDKPLKEFLDSKMDDSDFVSSEKIKQVIDLRSKIIATTLMSLRSEKELSVDDLAERTGISAHSIHTFETGEAKIPYSNLETLCDFFGLKASDFISHDNVIGQLNLVKKEFNQFLK